MQTAIQEQAQVKLTLQSIVTKAVETITSEAKENHVSNRRTMIPSHFDESKWLLWVGTCSKDPDTGKMTYQPGMFFNELKQYEIAVVKFQQFRGNEATYNEWRTRQLETKNVLFPLFETVKNYGALESTMFKDSIAWSFYQQNGNHSVRVTAYYNDKEHGISKVICENVYLLQKMLNMNFDYFLTFEEEIEENGETVKKMKPYFDYLKTGVAKRHEDNKEVPVIGWNPYTKRKEVMTKELLDRIEKDKEEAAKRVAVEVKAKEDAEKAAELAKKKAEKEEAARKKAEEKAQQKKNGKTETVELSELKDALNKEEGSVKDPSDEKSAE